MIKEPLFRWSLLMGFLKIGTFIFIMALLSSCSPCLYMSKHCPAKIKDSTVTHIKDSTSITVDTIWRTYHNPIDSLSLSDNLSAYMDSLGKCKVKSSTGSVESGKMKIKYIVRNDSIFIEANTKPYEIKIAELQKTIDHYREIASEYYHSEERMVTVKKKDSWFSHLYTWIALALIAFFVFTGIVRRLGFKLAFTITPPFISLVRR